MNNKHFLHYNDKGESINLSGKHKDNRQIKTDYQKMIESWRRTLNYWKR